MLKIPFKDRSEKQKLYLSQSLNFSKNFDLKKLLLCSLGKEFHKLQKVQFAKLNHTFQKRLPREKAILYNYFNVFAHSRMIFKMILKYYNL